MCFFGFLCFVMFCLIFVSFFGNYFSALKGFDY